MLKSLSKWFFSMKSALILMLLFAISIGVATFIENDYGTQTARALIYNAKWFEILLVLLTLNLAYNIVRFRLFRREKFFTGLFHMAFIVIAIGAAMTRYIGYEGIMHIREGETSRTMVSDRTYLQIEALKGDKIYRYEEPLYLSKIGSNNFRRTIDFGGEEIEIQLEQYLPSAEERIVPDKSGRGGIELILATQREGKVRKILEEGEILDLGGVAIAFDANKTTSKPTIQIFQKEKKLSIKGPQEIVVLSMKDLSRKSYPPGTEIPFEKGHLYTIGNLSIVLQNYFPHAKVLLLSNKMEKRSPNPDLLTLKVTRGGESRKVQVYGKPSQIGRPSSVNFGDLQLRISYGAKRITLPFAIKLRDFQLQRYPGSMSPSSYASEVTVIDGNRSFDYRIYMNHVLDYKGYRFFQSSYDPDEKGTVLSVNHDPGTFVTYLGYLMLAVGMILHFFMPQSRFQKLVRLTKKVQDQRRNMTIAPLFLLAFALTLPFPTYGSPLPDDPVELARKISPQHAQKFGSKLLIQDSGGRIEPIDTLSRQILAKIARKEELYGLTPNQIFLGMLIFPKTFQKMEMISIRHPILKKLLDIPQEKRYATFNDFFDGNRYKLADLVQKALRKKPAERNQLDKEAIKVDERVNIAYMVYTGELLRIIPDPFDKSGKWVSPVIAITQFPQKEAQLIRLIMASYFGNVEEGVKSGEWSRADKSLDVIKDYQRYYGSSLIPPQSKIEAELLYNRLDIFNRLVPYYTLIGFVLLLLIIVSLVNPKFKVHWFVRIGVFLIFLGFLAHTFGMGLRWYIAGHAPWSDGYESMVYIAWATVLAGFFFVRRAPIAFAATSLLGGLILFVAHLNWLDPQITNLVPVLKSYWLMIHVSVITASYGFLGLSALLALIVLTLFIFLNDRNRLFLELTFKELTYINEMSLIIGLVLITIGNFLGGVWANESWGRYWGWDPKETWAAVTILIYAVVEHMRLVPGLNRLFLYNVASLLAYFSVIMTYFGVNFYLSGMHSYASGDPVPIPVWVYWAVAILGLIILGAYYKKRKYGVDIKI
ncbi:MAG: cytochrome c biogenesis protein CcsA [Epsilonproteobacteria bacterium]|nr:cytochrome C biogenesis protein [Campylobacterota bacterium]NPA56610.1 cytochrome c biogenesis protein CcsA [Campylobacterota bacterium]